IVASLLLLIAVRGMPYFWPANVVVAEYREPGHDAVKVMAEIVDTESVTVGRLKSAGLQVDEKKGLYDRLLLKVGSSDKYGADFRFLLGDWLVDRSYPDNVLVLERVEWGNFYGVASAVKQGGKIVATGEGVAEAWAPLQQRANDLRAQIHGIERG